MHSEHGPVGDRRILVNALRAARAEIAALTEQRDRAMKVVKCAAGGWDQLQRMYDGQDAEKRNSGEVGSIHRDIFEAWLDSLTEDAKALAALDTPSSPSLPESPSEC